MILRTLQRNGVTVTMHHSGIEISDIIGDQYIHKLYIDCTINEAIQEFKEENKIEGK